MKRPELADLVRKPEQAAHEMRPGKRSRHEHEVRQLPIRRAPPPLPGDPTPEASAPLYGAPGERSVPDLPIGVDPDGRPVPAVQPSSAAPTSSAAGSMVSASSTAAPSFGATFSLFSSQARAPLPSTRPGAGDIIGQATSAAAAGVEWIVEDDAAASAESIIGSGDRAPHLALAAGQARPPPPRPLATPDPLLGPVRARSRAECRRRCGKADTCDPSSELGCGGEYCGRSFAATRDAL